MMRPTNLGLSLWDLAVIAVESPVVKNLNVNVNFSTVDPRFLIAAFYLVIVGQTKPKNVLKTTGDTQNLSKKDQRHFFN